jgi:hypothetical protein
MNTRKLPIGSGGFFAARGVAKADLVEFGKGRGLLNRSGFVERGQSLLLSMQSSDFKREAVPKEN